LCTGSLHDGPGVGAAGGAEPFGGAGQSDGSPGSSLGAGEVAEGVQGPMDAQFLADTDLCHPGEALLQHVACAVKVGFGDGDGAPTPPLPSREGWPLGVAQVVRLSRDGSARPRIRRLPAGARFSGGRPQIDVNAPAGQLG